jgi:hypothetical protein
MGESSWHAPRLFCFMMAGDSVATQLQLHPGKRMATKTTKLSPWTTGDVRMLKTLALGKTKTALIARQLKKSGGATYAKATALAVILGMRLLVMLARVLALLT